MPKSNIADLERTEDILMDFLNTSPILRYDEEGRRYFSIKNKTSDDKVRESLFLFSYWISKFVVENS